VNLHGERQDPSCQEHMWVVRLAWTPQDWEGTSCPIRAHPARQSLECFLCHQQRGHRHWDLMSAFCTGGSWLGQGWRSGSDGGTQGHQPYRAQLGFSLLLTRICRSHSLRPGWWSLGQSQRHWAILWLQGGALSSFHPLYLLNKFNLNKRVI
jgi:hypothetical protein